MSRYIGPLNKRARAIGQDLGLKTNSVKVARRLTVGPGQHGAKQRRKHSDFGIQLKEKQKLRFIYGITERQLHKMYQAATKSKESTGEQLLALLELRLDNVIYRLGWAPTRAAARQLVSHCHVQVNAKKMSIASYQCHIDDVITITKKGLGIPQIDQMVKEELDQPAWLQKKSTVGKVARLPERIDIAEAIEEQLVVEYYSR
ncbi:30S ribosomal protein S4 [Candidatus Woesebacteria bacterium]|nr:30S ribosomal protein S4 [Candidatus Woesebacteria bacterium]